MTTTPTRPAETFVDNDQKPLGHGRMLRKEDRRFVRGRGRYLDDLIPELIAARDRLQQCQRDALDEVMGHMEEKVKEHKKRMGY